MKKIKKSYKVKRAKKDFLEYIELMARCDAFYDASQLVIDMNKKDIWKIAEMLMEFAQNCEIQAYEKLDRGCNR